MIYLLDTDHVSLLQRGGTAGQKLIERLGAISPDDYGTTIISFKEQTEGWLAQINRAKTREVEILALARLNDTLRFYANIAVWQYSSATAARFEALRKVKVRIGTQDLKIAAIALANDATLLTCNLQDFGKVPDLRVEDWTV